MKSLSRMYVWWPDINKEVGSFVHRVSRDAVLTTSSTTESVEVAKSSLGKAPLRLCSAF